MNMREVISYNKDLSTGEVASSKKTKHNIGIKGKVLVELFDATSNEKIKEAYTENGSFLYLDNKGKSGMTKYLIFLR